MKTQRLIELFDNPDLLWIRQRLRERVEQGRGLGGSIALASPTESEVIAFSDLLGKSSRSRKRISINLLELEGILQTAGLAENLDEAVFLLEGTLENKREQREQIAKKWCDLFKLARSQKYANPAILRWLDKLESDGLLKRLATNLDSAKQLLDQAFKLCNRLPEENIALPTLAAAITGDSHALDYGKPLASVVLPLLARMQELSNWQTPEERRAVWAANGILCDALSQPVLIFNLRLSPDHSLAPLLESAYNIQDAGYLTTRQLARFPITHKADCQFDTVYICENPAIVAAAVEANGQNCKPLICTSGNLTTAAQTLLAQLSKAGIELRYHGDFDWPGIKIANFVFDKFNAKPWRMDELALNLGQVAAIF